MKRSLARLLVVDDAEMNRDMLSRRLERAGYGVLVAANGQRALELIETESIALVLLDIEMPGLSGLQVLTTLRRRYSAVQLPIIMVTARQQTDDVVEALQLGANDYLTKPVDFPIALARIRTQLSLTETEAALRESEERYALAANGANDGLWDWNLSVNTVYFSARWKRLVGCREDELDGCPEDWFGRIHPDDHERVRNQLAAHLSGERGHFESEHRIRHASGAYRWVLSRGLAVRDSSGTPHRIAGSLTDITDGKVSDALTGLPNRILFEDRLKCALAHAKRNKDYLFALMFLDLDRFKLVNDSLGHVIGDRLLRGVASRLEETLRSSDALARVGLDHTVARFGGDEFTILLEDIRHHDDALAVGDRIQQVLAAPFMFDSEQVFTSASIGIVTSASGYTEPEPMLRDADTAMYRAKALGKARCEMFDSTLRTRAVARLQIETDLRNALERRELGIRYQPIVSLETGRLAAFEALVRWHHPVRGMVMPAEFIQVAEETGSIVQLGQWVLREACRQMVEWRSHAPDSTLEISVNLSGRQFAQSNLLEQVCEVLDETGLPPSSLKLEITESAIIENVSGAIAKLVKLKALGVQLAIDDFGTGYSSLSSLHRFPFDSLKVDRSFVTRIGDDSAEIVRAIVHLAHGLGLEVVAEGIETSTQMERLHHFGCEFGQGYLFSVPLESKAAGALIDRRAWKDRCGSAAVPCA